MKRVTLFLWGTRNNGKIICVQDSDSLEDVLANAGQKLGISAARIFTEKGGEVDDVALLRDDEVLFVSQDETADLSSSTESTLNDHYPMLAVEEGDWVTLNVGGRYFTTTRRTLTANEPDSMLAKMFDNSKPTGLNWTSRKDPNGAYLIDRSPDYFEPILNYLRHGQLILNKGINPLGVLEEAKFFGIMGLAEDLDSIINEDEPPGDQTPITRREFALSLMFTSSNSQLRCQGMNFSGADLSRLDLRYVNFKHATLKKAKLAGTNLSCCNFERADLSQVILDGANLLGAKFLCANLEGASMRGCNFEDPAGSRANMEGANMKSVDLEGSHMAAVNLRVATLKNANLQNCDLRAAVLAGADLENCDLSGCDLQEANLRGANLKGATFELMLNPLHMSQTIR
ncbi:BTB/POZ domain-containing protein KCTD9-like [Lineus longissimus]|uniref:BTB/POZ domain-containing protein KCTD9-like n=1 Tax=Lineus longissimus TaxID=88925 RepID=UPI002B4CE200